MNICEYCDNLGGYHSSRCPDRALISASLTPKAPRPTRIEWTGNIQVHHPVHPAKP